MILFVGFANLTLNFVVYAAQGRVVDFEARCRWRNSYVNKNSKGPGNRTFFFPQKDQSKVFRSRVWEPRKRKFQPFTILGRAIVRREYIPRGRE